MNFDLPNNHTDAQTRRVRTIILPRSHFCLYLDRLALSSEPRHEPVDARYLTRPTQLSRAGGKNANRRDIAATRVQISGPSCTADLRSSNLSYLLSSYPSAFRTLFSSYPRGGSSPLRIDESLRPSRPSIGPLSWKTHGISAAHHEGFHRHRPFIQLEVESGGTARVNDVFEASGGPVWIVVALQELSMLMNGPWRGRSAVPAVPVGGYV